jgi:protein ImuB
VEQVAWALLDGGANLAPSDAWVQRDYFVARSEHAGLLWVFRQAAPNEARQSRWYLHGWFA